MYLHHTNFILGALYFALITFTYAYNDNSKFIGNDISEERRLHNKRKRPGGGQGANSPCHFGNAGYGSPKGTGRTFFDLQFFNVQHSYQTNINCGGGSGSYTHPPVVAVEPAPVAEIHPVAEDGGGHKPLGGHRPLGGHKPLGGHGGGGLFGGHGNGGGGGLFFPNRPNRPFQGGSFGGGSVQTQGGTYPQNSGAASGPGTGAFSSAFAGIIPSPQQFATGLSDGIQSFIGTIPAIGQSFQSILPNFGNFQLPQLPQFNPGGNPISNPVNRPPAVVPPAVTAPPLVTTTDPDDVIYSDEIKPVHEDFDPITEPYLHNKLPPGRNNRYYQKDRDSFQRRNQNYGRQFQSFAASQSRSRPEGRNFRFPS